MTDKCPVCNYETYNEICCSNCAESLKKHVNKIISQTKYCDGYTAPFINRDIIRELIFKCKFDHNSTYIKLFSKFMDLCDIQETDLKVSVPRYQKDSEYKYNNISKQLAKEIKIGGRYRKKALIKTRETKRQHNLEFSKRLDNLKDSFKINGAMVKNKTVLICDDLITTGATIDEISKELKRSGAKEVYAISIAVSQKLVDVN